MVEEKEEEEVQNIKQEVQERDKTRVRGSKDKYEI